MKDAKGHGSDPHGAHQNKVMRLSEHQSYKIIPSSIPGLQYVKDQITSSKYFTLQHAASGKNIADWRSAPVKETDKNFVGHIDSVVAKHGIDWTKNEAELGKSLTPERGARLRDSLFSAVNRDSTQYTIRKPK